MKTTRTALGLLCLIALALSCTDSTTVPLAEPTIEFRSDLEKYSDALARALATYSQTEYVDERIHAAFAHSTGNKLVGLSSEDDAHFPVQALLGSQADNPLTQKVEEWLRQQGLSLQEDTPLADALAKTYEDGQHWKVHIHIPFHDEVDWSLPLLYSGAVERGSDLLGYRPTPNGPEEIIITEAMARVQPTVVMVPYSEENPIMEEMEQLVKELPVPDKASEALSRCDNTYIVYAEVRFAISNLKASFEELNWLNPNTDLRIMMSPIGDNSPLDDLSDLSGRFFGARPSQFKPYLESETIKIHMDEIGQDIWKTFYFRYENSPNGGPLRHPYLFVTIFEYDWYGLDHKINLLNSDGTYAPTYHKIKTRNMLPRRVYFTNPVAQQLLINSECENPFWVWKINDYIKFRTQMD